MQENDLPITLGYWLLALIPIVLLLVLLVGLRWKAAEAAPLGMFAAAAIALTFYESGWDVVAIASGKGIWDAIFILYVVWPALLLYRIVDSAGGFDALRRGIARFSRNDLYLILAFGWVFASFTQGIAGFGTPIAIVAPLLLALGVRPIFAVAVPLIGHAWANMFGTLAVGWLATLTVVDLQDETRTAFETAILLWIPNIIGGLAIAWLYGRTSAVWKALPLVAVISVIHGGGQLGLTLWNPVLSNFIPASVALVAIVPFSRWERYSEPDDDIESQIMEKKAEGEEAIEEERGEPVMGLSMALFPYGVLTVLAVVALAVPPVEERLDQFDVGLPFAGAETGYDVEIEEEDPYSPFAPLTHPGTMLLAACLVAWLLYRRRGYYEEWAKREEVGSIGRTLVESGTGPSVAIIGFLVMSKLMDHSGQTDVLALGIGEIAPAAVFAFVAVWIGVLGAFMTSSNTASNVLFAPLQQTVAEAEELRESAIIGAQSAGGAIGNVIAPANVVLGTGTVGISGQEGSVLRLVLPYAVVMAVGVGIGTMLLLVNDLF
jgi:lactate permease